MMNRMGIGLYVTALMALSIFLLPTNCLGAGTEIEIDSLRGLDGVALVVGTLDEDIVNDGLTGEMLRQSVESILKSAEIPVIPTSKLTDTPGMPILTVSLNSLKHEAGLYAYELTLELHQVVLLARDTDIPTLATTWSTGGVGMTIDEDVGDITLRLTQLTGQFARDYVLANAETDEG